MPVRRLVYEFGSTSFPGASLSVACLMAMCLLLVLAATRIARKQDRLAELKPFASFLANAEGLAIGIPLPTPELQLRIGWQSGTTSGALEVRYS